MSSSCKVIWFHKWPQKFSQNIYGQNISYQEAKVRRRRLGEEEQAAMISKFALILLIFNNICILI